MLVLLLGDVAYVLGYFEPEIDPAISLIDRALKLSPSYAIGWTRSGWLRLWARHPDFAIEHFEESLRLNPMRRAPASFGIAVAHFFARRLDKAAAMLFLSMQETPSWAPCYRFLASCYAHLGRLGDAQSVVEKAETYHAGPGPMRGALASPRGSGLLFGGIASGHWQSWQGWISLMEWQSLVWVEKALFKLMIWRSDKIGFRIAAVRESFLRQEP
jgi:tetratricopeptide (TPR) repeat protein